MEYSKNDFRYAALYDAENGAYVTDGMADGLVMGPETSRRFAENDEAVAVTVCCITYNHEKIIREALDGFVNQKTDFKFKVFVGEDCGPDGTADVVREYAARYPDIIVPFIRKENMGAQSNLIDLCNHAKSPYIAFCEGDDFWIDEYKLQKQFDYMQTHTDVRMCYTNTEILAPEDWHLNNYYKHNKDGKMILPGCAPGFQHKPFYTAKDFIITFPGHTSSAFYRWNYDLEVPDWYFTGLIGDTPITILQMGLGKAVYLPDITSVYRRSDVGVFMNGSDLEHFANTRLDYVRLLAGLRSYFFCHFGGDLDSLFRYRITREITNYLNSAKNYEDVDMVRRLADEYPREMFEAMHTFIGSYNIYLALKRRLGDTDLFRLYHTKSAFVFAFPGLKVYGFFSRIYVFLRKLWRYMKDRVKKRGNYWRYTKVDKIKNRWVFSGFRHANYMDNTMYLYQYVVDNHPEIDAMWLTTSRDVYQQIKEEGRPVRFMNSREGREYMSTAEIAVTDHFAVTDFNPNLGFNDRTKVVQLWHGVGFKSMGDGKKVKNTSERGVRYSGDILVSDKDNALVRLIKRMKYRFLAPFREKFEKYFLFVCPGQERLDMIADVWHIPHENCFMAGHPRDLPVYTEQRSTDPFKVMFAPTYRFDYAHERGLVEECLAAAPAIQALMERINGEFYIRMHPHTWRNYKQTILRSLEEFDRIFLDDEKDVYQTLGTYSVVISDYSSIALDFALLGRPVVFHCPDYEWFCENEAGFNLDFPAVIPGPMTGSWDETLEKVGEYIANPDKDSALRKEKCKYFFDAAANGPDNSERIVAEIKKRIGIA